MRRCRTRSSSRTRAGKQALRDDPALVKGLNIVDGKVTYQGVAEAFGMEYHAPEQFLK